MESAYLCGFSSKTKTTKNNKYDKNTKCNAQSSCKKCSAHIGDDGSGHDSMNSMETGPTNTGKNGKGKGRKNQENSSGDFANRSDHASIEAGAPSTDRDRRGQGRRNAGDSSGEFDDRSDHDSKDDSKRTNTSKPGSSISTFKRNWKKELEEIEENQSAKSKIKANARDSSPIRTSTDTNPLTNRSMESAYLCGFGSKTKTTKNNKYDKNTKCNAQNSCKKCSAHIGDDDGPIRSGNDSMELMETGATNAGMNGKGKGRKNQEHSSGDFANCSDYASMEAGAPSTDRDKRGQGRRNAGDPSEEFVNQKSKMANGASRQQDSSDSSKLTKGKDSGKTPTQGIRGSLDDRRNGSKGLY